MKDTVKSRYKERKKKEIKNNRFKKKKMYRKINTINIKFFDFIYKNFLKCF